MTLALFYTFCAALALVVPATITYLVLLGLLFSLLRRSHEVTFQELGEPSFFTNNSISNGLRVVRFLLQRDYRELHDPKVERLSESCRTIFIGTMALFAVAVVAVVLYWTVAPR